MWTTRKQRSRRTKTKRRGGYHKRSWFSRLTGSKLALDPDGNNYREDKCATPLKKFEERRNYSLDSKYPLTYKFQNEKTKVAFKEAFPDFKDYTLENKQFVLCGSETDPMVVYSQYQPQNVEGLSVMSKNTRNLIEKKMKRAEK